MTTNQRVRTLTEPECLKRLERSVIGRVAWNTVDGPQVLPVTYRVHHRAIVFRTSVHGALAELARPRKAAFEVDEYDLIDRTGWSVLVSGHSGSGTRPDDLIRLWSEADPEPWAGGTRNLFITIRMEVVTGRLVGP